MNPALKIALVAGVGVLALRQLAISTPENLPPPREDEPLPKRALHSFLGFNRGLFKGSVAGGVAGAGAGGALGGAIGLFFGGAGAAPGGAIGAAIGGVAGSNVVGIFMGAQDAIQTWMGGRL